MDMFLFCLSCNPTFYYYYYYIFLSLLVKFVFTFDCRVSFADPVAVRHALEILSELATKDPHGAAIALGD